MTLCPECKSKSNVEDGRLKGKHFRRRRECRKCGQRFSTLEVVVPDDTRRYTVEVTNIEGNVISSTTVVRDDGNPRGRPKGLTDRQKKVLQNLKDKLAERKSRNDF